MLHITALRFVLASSQMQMVMVLTGHYVPGYSNSGFQPHTLVGAGLLTDCLDTGELLALMDVREAINVTVSMDLWGDGMVTVKAECSW